jgi:thiamine kinase-like enzyme
VSLHTPLLVEPAAREKKPEGLPPAIARQLENLVHAKITGTAFAFGGLSVSAAFIFTLDDGRKVFAKGAHPGDTAHAAKNLGDEIAAYLAVDILKKVAPRYIGSVTDGKTDGWMLGAWEAVEHDPARASIARVAESLKTWQRSGAAALPVAREHNYISQLLSPARKWSRLRDDEAVRKKFFGLFVDPGAAPAWFEKNIAALCQRQERAGKRPGGQGLVHGDLRIDNFLFGRERSWVIDWPNACRGPLDFDLVFLSSNMEALGMGRAEDFFTACGEADCVISTALEQGDMLAALSGYFADQAYRAPVEKMPRLRWMQKSMLLAQLRYMARLGLIESPPQMIGEKQ